MRDLVMAGFCVVLWVGGVGCGWWWCSARHSKRVFDAQVEGYEAVLAERQAPRHARGGPLPAPAPVREPNPPSPGRASRTVQPSREQLLDAAIARHPSSRRKRAVTTAVQASDLPAPVIWPEPGTQVPMRPQPRRTSGAGTQTMPALSQTGVTYPRLTDTGEIRKLADDWAERIRREQAVWSQEYHDRCEADRQEAGLTP